MSTHSQDRSCPTSVTLSTSQHVRLDKYQTKSFRRRSSVGTGDHEFEWYDLDAMHNRENKSNFHAGLVITSTRQVLEPQANQSSTLSENARRRSRGVRETTEDRIFRHRMKKLEEEIYGDSDTTSLSSSMHSLSSSIHSLSSLSYW